MSTILDIISWVRDYSKGIKKIQDEFYLPSRSKKSIKAADPEVLYAFNVNEKIAVEVKKLDEKDETNQSIFLLERIDNHKHKDTLNAFVDNLKDCHDELKEYDTKRFNFIFMRKAQLLKDIYSHAEKMEQFFNIFRVSIETNANPKIDFSVYIDDENALDFWLEYIAPGITIKYANFVEKLKKAGHDTSGIELSEYPNIKANVEKTKISLYTFNRIIRLCSGWPEFLAKIKLPPESPDENFIQKISNTNTRVSPNLIFKDDMPDAEPILREYENQAILGAIFLINRNGLLLSSENNDNESGARVTAYIPFGSTYQQWILGEDGKIINAPSKLYLTTKESREGSEIVIMHDTKRDTQKWMFVPPGIIVSKANSNLALMIDETTFAVTLVPIESGRATPFRVINYAPSMKNYNSSLGIEEQPEFKFYTEEARAFLAKAMSENKGLPSLNPVDQPPPPMVQVGEFWNSNHHLPRPSPSAFAQPPMAFDANQPPADFAPQNKDNDGNNQGFQAPPVPPSSFVHQFGGNNNNDNNQGFQTPPVPPSAFAPQNKDSNANQAFKAPPIPPPSFTSQFGGNNNNDNNQGFQAPPIPPPSFTSQFGGNNGRKTPPPMQTGFVPPVPPPSFVTPPNFAPPGNTNNGNQGPSVPQQFVFTPPKFGYANGDNQWNSGLPPPPVSFIPPSGANNGNNQ